jgi:uroporphyrinogen decarboxylase
MGIRESLSSRERVIRSLYREPVDRVPINYLANAAIDRRLKESFKLAPDADEALLQALKVDIRELHLPYLGEALHQPKPDRQVDPQWGIVSRWVEHEHGGYWDYCDFPLQNLDIEQVDSWPMPSPDDFDYNALREQASGWGELALCFGNPGLGDILNTTGMLCSMESVYIALAEENEAWLHLVDRRLEIQLAQMERSLETLQGRIDFIWMGEDLGTQLGPLISKEMFRKVIRPRHQRFIDLADAYNVPVMIHSCGSSSWAFDDFIEMGIVDMVKGGVIPTEFIPSCDKGFQQALQKGTQLGFPIVGVRAVVNDGAFHPVDSSDMAFQTAALSAFREAYEKAHPIILEPIMKVVVEGPTEFQGNIFGSINQRRGIIVSSTEDGSTSIIEAEVPLSEMFGYSTNLRSLTQGKAEYTMELSKYNRVPTSISEELKKSYLEKRKGR